MCPRTASPGSAERNERLLPARAALLHDLGPVEARQLAESVIAVNYRPLHDLGVSQEEAGLCEKVGGVSRIQTKLQKVASFNFNICPSNVLFNCAFKYFYLSVSARQQ